jgi:hypothetical protein
MIFVKDYKGLVQRIDVWDQCDHTWRMMCKYNHLYPSEFS